MRVHDDKGQPVVTGEIGGIEVKGPNVFVGYLDMPDKTAEAFTDDGWFRTGDVGQIDDDAYVHLIGRAKDLIITGGFNVYAREVEDTLLAHPMVAEAAVLGLPDAEWGEIVAAFVVLRPNMAVEPSTLQTHCGERIAGYKKPRHLEFVDAMPRNLAGKVVKATLRDTYLARQAKP